MVRVTFAWNCPVLKTGVGKFAKLGILASIPNDSKHNIPLPPFKDTATKHMNVLPEYKTVAFTCKLFWKILGKSMTKLDQ